MSDRSSTNLWFLQCSASILMTSVLACVGLNELNNWVGGSLRSFCWCWWFLGPYLVLTAGEAEIRSGLGATKRGGGHMESGWSKFFFSNPIQMPPKDAKRCIVYTYIYICKSARRRAFSYLSAECHCVLALNARCIWLTKTTDLFKLREDASLPIPKCSQAGLRVPHLMPCFKATLTFRIPSHRTQKRVHFHDISINFRRMSDQDSQKLLLHKLLIFNRHPKGDEK